MVTERFLQHVWQHRLFNQQLLTTEEGEPLRIVEVGVLNKHQGPDFIGAIVQIGDTVLAGAVEVHIKSSGWIEHKHDVDPLYRNVVLHVVWEADRLLNTCFSTFCLNGRVSFQLLQSYESLINNASIVPCANLLCQVSTATISTQLDKIIFEKLENKSHQISNYLKQVNYHWEAVFLWLLFQTFGGKVNGEAFLMVAQSIPLTILLRHKNNQLQLEALLLGQAGILNQSFTNAYPIMLMKEYQYLKKKYGLREVRCPIYQLRMRPAGFPCVRLSQLAALISKQENLFTTCLATNTINELTEIFKMEANDYWHYHYLPDRQSSFKIKRIGKQLIQSIVINTIVPLMFAIGKYRQDEDCKKKSIEILKSTPAESNSITLEFAQLSIMCKNALQSQSLLHLKKEYCNKKRCLDCEVGLNLLKR